MPGLGTSGAGRISTAHFQRFAGPFPPAGLVFCASPEPRFRFFFFGPRSFADASFYEALLKYHRSDGTEKHIRPFFFGLFFHVVLCIFGGVNHSYRFLLFLDGPGFFPRSVLCSCQPPGAAPGLALPEGVVIAEGLRRFCGKNYLGSIQRGPGFFFRDFIL